MAFGLSAGAVGLLGAGVGAASGALGARSNRKAIEEANKANAPDPRINGMLFGDDKNGGLLQQYQKLGAQEQGTGLRNYGESSDHYLGSYGQTDMQKMRDTASGLQGGGDLASIGAWAKGNMVDAPSQNNLDLSGSYNSLINGAPGSNPYLTQSLQGGMAQSKNMFDQMQGAATENLQENILPGIRSNSVLAGQYGSSRQGIAEGNAIGDNQKAMQQAANQFGQNNTNQMAGAQLQAYDADRNRQLQATQGLGAQQYGVAQQNAQTKNAAEFMNVNNVNDVSKFNAQQSNVNKLAGVGAQQGLLGQTLQGATNQDNYGLNKAGMTNGLLQPYLSNQPAPNQQPLSQSTAGNVLGGAAAGLGLYNQFKLAGNQPSAGHIDGAMYKNNPLFDQNNYVRG